MREKSAGDTGVLPPSVHTFSVEAGSMHLNPKRRRRSWITEINAAPFQTGPSFSPPRSQPEEQTPTLTSCYDYLYYGLRKSRAMTVKRGNNTERNGFQWKKKKIKRKDWRPKYNPRMGRQLRITACAHHQTWEHKASRTEEKEEIGFTHSTHSTHREEKTKFDETHDILIRERKWTLRVREKNSPNVNSDSYKRNDVKDLPKNNRLTAKEKLKKQKQKEVHTE